MTIFLYLAIAIILILTFLRPYLGLVFIIASLTVVDVLPTLPLLSSVFPLFGLVTVLSFLIHNRNNAKTSTFRFTSLHFIGLLLIGWIFVSNAQAAWFGSDRNWVLTYVQLWVLMWLAGTLLDTPQKHQTLMWVYSIIAIGSALVAIQQGNIAVDFDTSTRSGGLSEGINTAARYFVVAMVFLIYLRSISPHIFMRIAATVGVVITIVGELYTISRTGMVLLAAAFVLLILMQPRMKYRIQIMVGFGIVLLAVWLFFDNIVGIASAIVPAVTQGTDTIGLRYALWKAGWRMWVANPITGVGIGMYVSQVKIYGLGIVPVQFLKGIVAHNMFVSMLAETGAVGFGLFMFLLIKPLQDFWRGGSLDDPELVRLRNVWLTIFVVMLLGGMTKTDQADKLIWLTMGVSVFFNQQWKVKKGRESLLRKQNNVET